MLIITNLHEFRVSFQPFKQLMKILRDRKIIITLFTMKVKNVNWVYVTGFGKRDLIAQIMIFLYRRFSATTPKNNSRDKTFVFVSEVSPTLFLHSRVLEGGSISKRSSALFKDSYLKVLFHNTISMIRG